MLVQQVPKNYEVNLWCKKFLPFGFRSRISMCKFIFRDEQRRMLKVIQRFRKH
jgi:hypothetical protein